MNLSCSRAMDHGVPGSLVGDIFVVDRKRQYMPLFPRWVSVLGAYTLAATVLGLVALLDTRHQRADAQDFLDTGVQTMADSVEVAHGCCCQAEQIKKSGGAVDRAASMLVRPDGTVVSAGGTGGRADGPWLERVVLVPTRTTRSSATAGKTARRDRR